MKNSMLLVVFSSLIFISTSCFAEDRQATLSGEDAYAPEAACRNAFEATQFAALCPVGDQKNVFVTECKCPEDHSGSLNPKFHCSLSVTWVCEYKINLTQF